MEVSSRRKGDVSLGLCVEATCSSFVSSLWMAASIAANASTAEDTDTDDERDDTIDDDGSIVVGCSVVCCSSVVLSDEEERMQHPVWEHLETTVRQCRFC
mmetsp:Transcript_23761/g.26478  ORF Transcript_23761/g.26478 Transcript_23761/m.26478 type:complete len:100 (+) Transcript_23761:185-484(+)